MPRKLPELRGNEAIDLPKGLPIFIDVISTRQPSAEFLPAIKQILNRYKPLMSSIGIYRFTVLVTGDGVKAALLGLSFEWKGQWDTFEVSQIKPKS